MDLSLSVLSAVNECSVGPCEDGRNQGGTSMSEVVTSPNRGSQAKDVLVVVDSNVAAPASLATYSLNLNLTPFPVGDTCSDTQPAITASTTLGSETLSGYTNDYSQFSQGCDFTSGPDRTYRVVIPPSQRLNARAFSSNDLRLSLIAGPASNCETPIACIAQGAGFVGDTALSFNNTTGTAQTVFLVVDRSSSTGSSYTLSINIAP